MSAIHFSLLWSCCDPSTINLEIYITFNFQDLADFRTQYPQLSADIDLPIYCTAEHYFSSVLRIGSPGVQLWTHYDVRFLSVALVSFLTSMPMKELFCR